MFSSNRASDRTPKLVGRLAKLISQPARQIGAAALALGDVVGVHVGPRQVERRQRRRVVELREPGGLRGHEAVEADADGGLPVARQVVDHRQPGRPVLPRRERDVVVGLRIGEASDVGRLARDRLLVEVEAHAVVQRQAIERPRILGVEAEVRVKVLTHLERGVEHGHLERRAVVVGLIQVGVGVVVAGVADPTGTGSPP